MRAELSRLFALSGYPFPHRYDETGFVFGFGVDVTGYEDVKDESSQNVGIGVIVTDVSIPPRYFEPVKNAELGVGAASNSEATRIWYLENEKLQGVGIGHELTEDGADLIGGLNGVTVGVAVTENYQPAEEACIINVDFDMDPIEVWYQ